MKQKIVMNVHMHNDKNKSKAMKIAVSVHGVISVSVGGEDNRLEIIGQGVDSVSLANSLRKKFPYTNIVSVEEIKDDTKSPDPSPPPSPPPPQPCPPPPQPYPLYNYCYPTPCPPAYYQCQYYDPGPPSCSIM